MLKYLLVGLICLLAMAPATLTAAERPNIVFFLSDDQRADFLGCAGHEILKTPTLDSLAARGVRFENAFVTTSICAASRATLFTGLWERSHRYTFGTPPIAAPLVAASYPVQLREAGYRTGFVGKFGVGINGKPNGQMFDYFHPLNRSPYLKKLADGSVRHVTDITGDKAIEFLSTCQLDQPFCLSVSFNASHAEDGDKKNHFPWPPAENGLYEEATIPPPLVSTDFHEQLPKFLAKSMNRDRYYWRWDTSEKYQHNVKAYYRMITGLDRNVGRVMKELEKLGKADNTVILFMGDNGYYKGSRGFAGKWSHYEESLRVPLIMFDPRMESSLRGHVADEMALNVDVPATILSLAGVTIPDSYQGASLIPVMTQQDTSSWRKDFFCEHLMHHAKIPKWEGVRGSRLVYARYFEHLPEGEFLHDLESDPQQLNNLVGDPAYAAELQTMRKRCNQLRNQLGGEYRRPGR